MSTIKTLNILQLNIDGITNKLHELKHTLTQHNIHIALIQETKLTTRSYTPKLPGYTTLRHDRTRGGGGGLITLIQKNIPFTNITHEIVASLPRDPTQTLELQATRITLHKQNIIFINTYIPPASSTPPDFTLHLDHLNTLHNTYILGDLNAHDNTWLTTQNTDTRGTTLQQQLQHYTILNNPTSPTRKPYNIRTQPTSPDLSLATPELALRSSWETLHELSSDHLPILIKHTLHRPYFPPPKQTFTNYKRADWDSFTNNIEQALADFDINTFTDINAATKHLTSIIIHNSKQHIPTGAVKRYCPGLNREIRQKLRTRNHLRKQFPTPDIINHLQALNTEITDDIRAQQRAIWKDTLATITFNTNPSALWRLIQDLNNKYTRAPDTHEALTTPNNSVPSPQQQANILNKHYANISRLPQPHTDRRPTRLQHRQRLDTDLPPPFTPESVKSTIDKTPSTSSTGPDGISYRHLKHLGPVAIRALTSIFNHSITHNSIPTLWKKAKIVPILKPHKTPTEPASYRPISLLFNPVKILERLVLTNITPHIPLSPTQHGFRTLHSTTTLLTSLTQTTLEGLNTPKPAHRTLLATIDISKAFDTVPRTLLTQKIFNTNIHINYKKWLANYLTGRQGYTIHNGKSSTTRRYTNGVPQGSVLSPTLFNLYMHDIPLPTHPDTHTLSYADDITIYTQHTKPETAATHLQNYIHTLEQWLETNRLKVSTPKSTLTLITPWAQEYNTRPTVTLHDTPIPYTDTPTILGVTFDRGMTFRQHTDNINNKAKTRLNVLRTLTNTSFGHSKEHITTVYKQFIRPILTYAHTAWQPDTADTHIQKLQTTQNTALRIATGCTNTTPIHHLHHETQVLPLKQHMDMRGTHQYTSTAHPAHPLHHLRSAPTKTPRSRPPHKTPASYYTTHLNSLPPTPDDITLRTHIHTVYTRRAIDAFPPNTILGAPPPIIDTREQHLPREDRVHLARLRCGHHTSIPTYMHRIGRASTPTCVHCNSAVGTVEHVLLHCPALQLHRDRHHIHALEHLWELPEKTVGFLRDASVI